MKGIGKGNRREGLVPFKTEVGVWGPFRLGDRFFPGNKGAEKGGKDRPCGPGSRLLFQIQEENRPFPMGERFEAGLPKGGRHGVDRKKARWDIP